MKKSFLEFCKEFSVNAIVKEIDETKKKLLLIEVIMEELTADLKTATSSLVIKFIADELNKYHNRRVFEENHLKQLEDEWRDSLENNAK